MTANPACRGSGGGFVTRNRHVLRFRRFKVIDQELAAVRRKLVNQRRDLRQGPGINELLLGRSLQRRQRPRSALGAGCGCGGAFSCIVFRFHVVLIADCRSAGGLKCGWCLCFIQPFCLALGLHGRFLERTFICLRGPVPCAISFVVSSDSCRNLAIIVKSPPVCQINFLRNRANVEPSCFAISFPSALSNG